MTKKIFEELPARKHSPAVAAAKSGGAEKRGGESGGADGGSEKKIRQAVYDIRYRARREGIDLRAAYAQYMQNSNLSSHCLLYTSPSPRDQRGSRMPSSA